MPHKFYHGRTGRVWNVTKRAVGVELNKQVGNRIMRKRIHAEAKAQGKIISTKRQPEGPKPGFMVGGAILETVTPIPYDVVNDLKGGY
ncbi:Large ribosomal subunit protein eL21x/eL21w [Salvia divinorum]|uniref:Large ribosomal subunit protein eL21x/eL21w n=1 Tax=Salvia divinorum TaxID=28513 RepID=A0ABD1IQ44_SALDI